MSEKSKRIIISALQMEIRASQIAIRERPKRDHWQQPMFDIREAHIADCRQAIKEVEAIQGWTERTGE